MRLTEPLIRQNNDERRGSKIDSFLQKLRESQTRALGEKTRQWGFDFEQSAPALPNETTATVSDEAQMANPIIWTPIFQGSISQKDQAFLANKCGLLPRKFESA